MSKGIPGMDPLLQKIAKAQAEIDRGIGRALMRGALLISGEAQRNVSGPRPERLGVVTGRLRSSISAVALSKYSVKVGTNVSYAAIHEFGGRTKPHLIVPLKKKALSWVGEGGEVFVRRVVHHPGSTIPARPYMRPAMETRRARVLEIVRAVYAGPLMLGGRLS